MSFFGKICVIELDDVLQERLYAAGHRTTALEVEKAAKKAAKKQQKNAAPQKRQTKRNRELATYISESETKKAKVALDGPVVTQTPIVDPILAQLFNQQRVLKEMEGGNRDQLAECDAEIARRKLLLEAHQKVHPLSDKDDDEDT